MRTGGKPILDTGFQIGVVDQSKRLLNSLEPDGLIVGNAGAFSSGPFEQILDIGVAFPAGDEEDGVGGQIVLPGIVGEAAIETGKGAFGEFECSGPVDFVYFADGHIHEDRNMTIGIQPHMQFNRTLLLAKSCPRERGLLLFHKYKSRFDLMCHASTQRT